MKYKEIIYRIRGISCPIFGISWEPPESERDIARRLIKYLEDRRVLYNPYELEDSKYCIESILEIRKFLTNEISKTYPGSELEKRIAAMRSACRKFLDTLQLYDLLIDYQTLNPIMGIGERTVFISALGELRGVFGIHLAMLAVAYGLDIEDDLVSIIPEIEE